MKDAADIAFTLVAIKWDTMLQECAAHGQPCGPRTDHTVFW